VTLLGVQAVHSSLAPAILAFPYADQGGAKSVHLAKEAS
jgi:hypothetical protein